MTKRTAMISPFQMLAMDSHNDSLNKPVIRGLQPPIQAHKIFYSSLIQAGLDEIIVQSDFEKYMPASDMILERVKSKDLNNWRNSYTLVESTFDAFMDTKLEDEKASSSLLALKLFLIDLLAALADHNSLILLTPFPNIDNLKLHLPPEIFIPVKNLFSCLRHIEPTVATPRLEILRDDVGRFQEVLSSSMFDNYVLQQSKLDDSSTDTHTASQSINEATTQLCKKYKQSLVATKIASILLPISSKIIDTVLGSLPGKLAESTSTAAESWLTQNKRVTVYNLDSVLTDLIQTTLTKGLLAELKKDSGL